MVENKERKKQDKKKENHNNFCNFFLYGKTGIAQRQMNAGQRFYIIMHNI